MTNNIEQKQRFIAQYLNTPAIWMHTDCPEQELVWDKRNFFNIDSGDYLFLKRLSDITNEDSIKVSEILSDSGIAFPLDERQSQFHIDYGKRHILPERSYMRSDVADYLRSKGYALRWMSISVEQQINNGWIKTSK